MPEGGSWETECNEDSHKTFTQLFVLTTLHTCATSFPFPQYTQISDQVHYNYLCFLCACVVLIISLSPTRPHGAGTTVILPAFQGQFLLHGKPPDSIVYSSDISFYIADVDVDLTP